jgi:hypothetical protein
VDWAVQMAEQGLLTGSAYTRPAGFDNLGLVAYAPNSDFRLIPLSHPAGGWSTVPRSVFEAIMAQESNWSQASWHAPAGTAGGPLVADYYGAAGGITSINYAGADCGYGIAQITTGMRVGDTSLSAHGQIKVAVDYQENIAAGLQILEDTWNQLYAAGLIANNGDPKYLENWYYAAWAYNSGIQPNAANGNTTGCTPGPTCTGPDGTWGLGWTNNPDNLDYPPNRAPYLQTTYADAAHPASWPYQERVLGWMASPLIRYGSQAYAPPTYHGGNSWVQPAPFASFCTLADNHCDPNTTNPTTPGASHCMLNDFQCWWHQPVTWIPTCATTCATSSYAVGTGSTEPGNPSQNPPTCTLDTAKVPGNAIIVDDQPSPPLNLQGCGPSNWSSNGTFTYQYGTNSAGDPIGAIDTHQLGTGLGGHILFTHTETGSDPTLINTGTWTPNLPSLQYYKIKLHIPGLGRGSDQRGVHHQPGWRGGAVEDPREPGVELRAVGHHWHLRHDQRRQRSTHQPVLVGEHHRSGLLQLRCRVRRGRVRPDGRHSRPADRRSAGNPGRPQRLQPGVRGLWLCPTDRGGPGRHQHRLLRAVLHRSDHSGPRCGAELHPQLRREHRRPQRPQRILGGRRAVRLGLDVARRWR